MSAQSPETDRASVRRLNPPTMWDATANGHSQISIAEPGRLAFLSGQVAWQADGRELPKRLEDQAGLIAANLQTAVRELGATAADIIMLRLYVVDGTTERFLQVWSALQGLCDGELPSVTVLGVAALFTPELQVEVEMTVRVP